MAETINTVTSNDSNPRSTALDASMVQTPLVDSMVNTEDYNAYQTDTSQSSVPMSNVITSQVPTCTLTPITTLNSMGEEGQAALLFLLNSSSLTSQAVTTTSCPGPLSNAVFVPQPVTTNVMVQGQNSSSKGTNANGGSNVIEKAMDLANLGEVSGGESIQHPVANAALTLVSLGSAVGQPVQEIVIDESGRSSLSHNSNLGEVSVTVESEGSSHVVSKTQVSGCTMVAPAGTSAISNHYDGFCIEDKTELKARLREVVTQTGGGEKEVVVLKSVEKSAGKSLSTLLVDQSLERKRLAELKKDVIEKERTHPCDKCEKKFFTKHDLKRHSLVHSEIRPYECQVCKKAFRTPNELKLHMPIHNTNTPYKCEFCGKEFRTKGCIKSHIKYHIGDKRHKCTICEKAFVKSADLKRHIAAHNNEKKYKCDECDSMFTRRDNLKAHMLLHSRKSVVTCKMCNKEFINEVYLKRHMHIHKQAKKKPYECQWCPKTYEQLEGLRRHIRQHVGDEKFVCDNCGKKFITAIQLKRHLWLSHEQNSPYRKSVL